MNFEFMLGRTQLLVKKHSPEILLVGGLVSMVSSVVLAAKAGQTHQTVKTVNAEEIETVKDETDDQREIMLVKASNAGRWVRLYGPSGGAFLLGAASIVWSHGIMEKRVTALGAAYVLLLEGFNNYRKRVRNDQGNEKDRYYLDGVRLEEVMVTEVDGNKAKTTKTELLVEDELGIYSFFFDDKSTVEYQYNDPISNRFFLETKAQAWTDKLQRRGHVFLNEVLEDLGLEHTQAGAAVGWIYDPNDELTDDYIDFGTYAMVNEDANQGLVEGWLLDFNVQGPIWNLI
jgi:hypothetical protein